MFDKRNIDLERGSAFIYILIAIALLAALTASFMRPASQQTTAQNSYQSVTEIKSQSDFIQSAIQECVLVYSSGDDSDTLNIPTGVTEPYPFTPNDNYFTLVSGSGAASAVKPNNNLENIGCPGNPGLSKDHEDIFGGRSGKFMPPPPDLFNNWQYYNDTDGVFYFISTDKTDAFLQTALLKLDEQYSECQADVIDASGGDVELTSTAAASDPKCLDGETCFRVWMIINPSASYLGDTDGEELAAGC